MKINTILPQAEIGSDPAPIRDFAQAVEAEQVPSWISYAAASLLIEASRPGRIGGGVALCVRA
jgi:hypothetical protein